MRRLKCFLLTLTSAALLSGCAFGGGGSEYTPEQVNNYLQTPDGVRYDDTTWELKWNSIHDASSYTIEVSSYFESDKPKVNTYSVESISFSYVPITEKTSFRIKASDSTNTYLDSNWSDSVLYEVSSEESEFTKAKVYIYLNNFISGKRIIKPISMHYEEHEHTQAGETVKHYSLFISAIYDYYAPSSSSPKIYQLEVGFDAPVTSLKQVILSKNYGSTFYILHSYDIKNYNSIYYYLQSNTYEGELENYHHNGWDIQVLTSQAYRMGSGTMGIDGVFKISKDSEIKYFAYSYKFYISDTANESVKYTRALVNIDLFLVEVRSFCELSGDYIESALLYS